MDIVVIAWVDENSRRVQIEGDGVLGTATWRGYGPPVLGAVVDVELDLGQGASWPTLDIPDSNQADQVSVLTVEGRVEHGDDEVAVLRIGDGLIMVEMSGRARPELIGRIVKLTSTTAEVFPSGL